MKNRLFYFCLAAASLLFITSCSRGSGDDGINDVDASDKTAPVITITKPSANQVYTSGDSIIVEGKVTDDKLLFKGKVQLKNDATGTVVATDVFETYVLSTINFRIAYKAVVSAATDFSILAEFQDRGNNISTTNLAVKVNP